MGLLPWFNHMAWDWGWGGWAWLAGVGVILLLGLFLLPWFFFLLNLHNLLSRVSPVNRAMPAPHVWLNFIPVFNLGWFLYTVVKVRDSVRNEYRARGWPEEGDLGYNLGLATGVLAIATFVLGWVPLLGWVTGIAQFVCWILYWLRTNELKNRLGGVAHAVSSGYGRSPSPAATPPPGSAAPSAPPGSAASSGAAASAGPAASEGHSEPVCAACGTPYVATDRYCRACGLRLPQQGGDA